MVRSSGLVVRTVCGWMSGTASSVGVPLTRVSTGLGRPRGPDLPVAIGSDRAMPPVSAQHMSLLNNPETCHAG